MTDNIKLFIQTNYTDSQLAALIAHTESGKLSYRSCCCLVGIPTAPHVITSAGDFCELSSHFYEGLKLPYGAQAEWEFCQLGGPDCSDFLRREYLKPILYAEVERREQERDYEDDGEYWTDADTTREMVNSIKGR